MMEELDTVLSICSTILEKLSKIQEYQEDWNHLSCDYQDDAEILRSSLKSVVEQARIHGLPVDSTVMKTLKKAEKVLSRAESRFKWLHQNANSDDGCYSEMWWLYAKLSITLFPERLQSTFEKVTTAIDGIPRVLEQEASVAAGMKEASERQAISTTVEDNDGLYVPIEKSQSAVIAAIEDSKGSHFILLHGGIGKGKSTLAKYVWELYGEKGKNRNMFEYVEFVQCENNAQVHPSTKQLQILEHLSPTSLGNSMQPENSSSKARTEKALRDFLSSHKVLIVLDDVSDKRFIYGMWNVIKEGKDVKCLVTSQRSDLFEGFTHDCLCIPMEDPDRDEAMKILASLVGLEGKIIPRQLQAIANKIVDATEGNPKALACVASQFYLKGDNDKQAWHDAHAQLCKSLDNAESKIVLGQNYDIAPKSLWAAYKLCLDSLETTDATYVLYLMYACKGQVPEGVLRILHSAIKTSSCTFVKSRGELSSKDLLKPLHDTLRLKAKLTEKDEIEEEEHKIKLWSLPSLVKLYMDGHMVGNKEEIRSTLMTLVDEAEKRDEKAKVINALCALYFEHDHIDSVVRDIKTRASSASNLEDSNNDVKELRRLAIEPIIWLLDQPEEEELWTESDLSCARQVFLKYVCERRLDDDNICHLLKLTAFPLAPVATLIAMRGILVRENTPLVKHSSLSFLEALLRLMGSTGGVQTTLQEVAFDALVYISYKAALDQVAHKVASKDGLLDVLVSSIQDSVGKPIQPSDTLAERAVWTLLNLTSGEEDDSILTRKQIVNKEGVVTCLVNSLFEHEKPVLQEGAANALGNLARTYNDLLLLKIVNNQGALAGLEQCLSKQGGPLLQIAAARALGNLADSKDVTIKLAIATQAGLLASLVRAMSEDESSLRKAVAEVLTTLALADDKSIVLMITNEEGAVECLLKCVSQDNEPSLQREAAKALTLLDLTRGKEASLHTAKAYEGRADAYVLKEMYAEALLDLDQAVHLEQPVDSNTLCARCFVKAHLGDLRGALEDANEAIKVSDTRDCEGKNGDDLRENLAMAFQERGILKSMMGDFEGALADLDEALKQNEDDYWVRKHRGKVKSLLNDVEGARKDAECAQRVRPALVDSYFYGKTACLGAKPAKYLGYDLK